ncbi:MBL fold metallo-hydrolase [Brachybacterium sp. DNPG3]
MSTTITVHGGVRVIGGTKILLETETARVLLDVGSDIVEGPDLLRAPVQERSATAAADRIRLGLAPRIPGLFDADRLAAVGPGADEIRALAAPDPRGLTVVLSHAHIDHDGLLPLLAAEVRVLAHPETISLHAALEEAELTPPGTAARLTPLPAGESVQIGDLEVSIHRVDHDILGAVGTIVRAPEGVLAYTGDINLHRGGGERTRAFIEAARGADALVCETTMLSFDPLPAEPRSEQEVAEIVVGALTAVPGSLHLVSAYERDVERAALLIGAAQEAGRTLVWPGRHAAVLTAMGVEGVATWDGSRPQSAAQGRAGALALSRGACSVGLDAVLAAPGGFLVQADPADMPALLDLPLGEGSAWIHSQGEPLGPFMPDWQPWQDWLAHRGVVPVPAGSSGHAGPAALAEIVRGIGPGRVIAVHGFHPERLQIEGVPTVLPELGEGVPLRGA